MKRQRQSDDPIHRPTIQTTAPAAGSLRRRPAAALGRLAALALAVALVASVPMAAAEGAAPAGGDAAIAVLLETPQDGAARLSLDPGHAASWNEVNVGRLSVLSRGEARRIDRSRATGRSLELALAPDRCSLVVAELGPGEAAGRGDSWQRVTHSAKLIACPPRSGPTSLAARLEAAGVLTAKVGGRMEIRPLLNPATLRAGRDLAVRLYIGGAPESGAAVSAHGPGNRVVEAVADGEAVATLRLPVAGRWTLRFPHPRSLGGESASLSFEIESDRFWQPLLAERAATTAVAMAAPELMTAQGTATPTWQPLGPEPIAGVDYAGRIAGLATSPNKPGRYLAAAASGGVWRTDSGGASWRPLGDELPSLSIGAVAFDPDDDRTLYAGSGEGHNAYHSLYGLGFYRSTDGGQRWDVLAQGTFAGRTISSLAVASAVPSAGLPKTVWATVTPAGGSFGNFEAAKLHPDRAGPNGLFRSTDRGTTWSHVTGPGAADLPAIPANDVDLDPSDPNRLFVALGDPYNDTLNGIYRSDDAGSTFARVLALGGLGRSELAVAPSDPQRLYVLVCAARLTFFNWGGYLPFGGFTQGVYRSDDGGGAWQYFYPGNLQGFQGNYNAAVAVHPGDPEIVFLGGVTMLRSTDGAATWTDVSPPHPDIHDIRFDAAGRLLAATDGGVYRSEDLGDSWQPLNHRLGTVQFYAGLSLHPDDRSVVLGGTQDNGTNVRGSFGPGWTMLLGGDGGYTAIRRDDPDTLFTSFQGTGNLFRSTDGGLTSTLVNQGIDLTFDVTAFQAPYQIDPNDSHRLLYATQLVYESTDLGDSWTPISGDLTDGDPANDLYAVRSLVIAPSNSQTVYATTNNQRLLVSTDGGHNWTLRRDDVYGFPRVMRQIAVDPADDAVAYVAVGRFGGPGVLATYDRGVSWNAVGGGLPDAPVNAVAVHRTGAGRLLLAGTDRGVWASTDEGTTWQPFGRKLANAPVVDLLVDLDHQRVVAATLGRGVWWLPLAPFGHGH